MDLSTGGVDKFCKDAAGRYGKTEEELRGLPLMELACRYMWNDRRRRFYETAKTLSVPCKAPILVISNKADPFNHSHMECSVLPGAFLSEILDCREGLSITFFSDGKDVRCEDITEDGTNFYLFREVKSLRGLSEFAASIEKGEPFTESELERYTSSLAPKIHTLMGWSSIEKESLDHQIQQASEKHIIAQDTEKKLVALER